MVNPRTKTKSNVPESTSLKGSLERNWDSTTKMGLFSFCRKEPSKVYGQPLPLWQN